ncbi:MAG TPA: hypothetical protein VGF82_01465 [Terracidiphilus sp.]|jgi:hypothetical protein
MADEAQLPVTSSEEPSWAPEATECYQGVLRGLLAANVPIAVSGGFAFHHHTGIWRTTKDLDLVLPPGAVPRAFEVLVREGFETYVQDPVWLAKARRGEYFVDLITGVGNATLTVEYSWIERAVEDEVLGIRCKVLCVEEMIASKLFVTRRERFDGADIAHLLRSRARNLDWERLRQLTKPHWQMLYWYLALFAYIYPSQITDVPRNIWRDLHNDFAESVTQPTTEQPFRGTLVDPKMFAIDVNEWGQRDTYRELWDNYPHPLEETNTTRSRE